MRLRVTTGTIPTGGPDTLLSGSPPACGFVPDTEELNVWLHAASGTAAVRPFSWNHGRWTGLGSDAVPGASPGPTTVTAGTNGSVSEGRYKNPGGGRYWLLFQESGTGVVDEASLDER